MRPLLRTDSLTVRYGGVRALDGVSLVVEEGALVGLIGPNGAGKTTLIDALTGFIPHQGSVMFDGATVDGLGPHRRARLGLVRTFQQVELCDDLDVGGNLLVAAATPRWWRPLVDLVRPAGAHRPHPAALDAAVALLEIEHLLERRADELSEGERKLVGVGRALTARPRLLLLDEPAAGLDTDESQQLGQRLERIVESGVSIVLVDHDIDLVMARCDTIHVLDHGAVLASGAPGDVMSDRRVVAAYLGAAG